MFRTFEELPPDGCEVYGKLKFYQTSDEHGVYVRAWRGRAKRPYAHYRFRTLFERERWIAKQKESHDVEQVFKAEIKAKRVQDVAAMAKTIQVRTLLHYSWGYEQTQCDFFEVVAKSGQRVTLRAIAAKSVPDSKSAYGGMADLRQPCPGQYIGEPFRKTISPFGVSMAHGSARPTDADEKHYCSWYG